MPDELDAPSSFDEPSKFVGDSAQEPTPPPPVQEMNITCPNCRYNLTGATIGSVCPECGLRVGKGMFTTVSQPTSGKATAALVLGILSIVGCFFWGFLSLPCGIVAMVLGKGVEKQVARGEVSPSSLSLAKAGSICGLIGTTLGVVGLIILGLMFASEGF